LPRLPGEKPKNKDGEETEMETIKELEKIVGDYKGTPTALTMNTTFDDLGFDSLDTVDLMMKVEEKLGVTFDDDLQISNLGELVHKIEQQRK
jgi:acyl carrier protein